MGIYPLKLYRMPPGAPPICCVCGGPPPEEGYVYYAEEEKVWTHRGCVHKFLQSTEARRSLARKVPITVGDEGAA